MFSQTSDLHDAIYSRIRDRREESKLVASIIRDHNPEAHSILDVACGTGERALHLSKHHGFRVDGIDIDASMVRQARKKKVGRYFQADMTTFDLNRTYDAVTCLFSSIGYVRTKPRLRMALQSMVKHMTREGVLLVEPWLEPNKFKDGNETQLVVQENGRTIRRVARSQLDKSLSRLHFEYTVQSNKGITRYEEEHVLGLFTRRDMQEAMNNLGLSVNYDPIGIADRGLYVGTFRDH